MKLVVTLAGIPIGLEISNATYRFVFEPYITPDRAPVAWIHVPEADLSAARPLYGRESSAAYVEYMELCPLVSDLLLSYRRVIFHSTAFLWHDKAWLLTAASGVGKTTQYIQWKRLYGEDVQILNGDKPILRFEEKSIYVCASPWTGKEGMGQNFEAPLGGILFLKQAPENMISTMSPERAAGPLFAQFLCTRKDTWNVTAVCNLLEEMLRSTPIYQYKNRGDIRSAALCKKMLERKCL